MNKRNIDDKNKNRKVDNKKDIELNKAQARVDEKEIARDMNSLLNKPEFIRFICRQLEYCKIYEDPFTGNSETFHNCGKMNVGKWIMGEIERYSPRALLRVMEQRVVEIEAQKLKEMEGK